MNDANWHRILELFEGAGELPADERGTWLDAHCGDPALRSEVEAMLAADERPVAILDRPEELLATGLEPLEGVGTQIGPYRLTERLGEGGMGTVWAARQEAPVQRSVALKLVKPGMDTRQVLERFEAERRLLARMDHPNVATLHDAGTTDRGRPYFVMPLIEGAPITRWCRHRALSARERIELFLPVCEAVQHAHQKGVIHRDLKPSNVLVSDAEGKPRPLVIDFGIAKLVDPEPDQASRTRAGARVGTPTYMSPEQLAGAEVDSRTDVYSLGALLYELLTGRPPLEVTDLTPTEAERRIRETVPRPPSTRSRATGARPEEPIDDGARLDRALDWITMKALEKDPERRYATPLELAADLRRYLEDRPVLAGPPSRWYRASTFVRRHLLAVALSAAFVLALIGGLAGTTWMAIEADRAREAAEREAREAEAVSDFLAEVLGAADPLAARGDTPARDIRVADLLTGALHRLEQDESLDLDTATRLRSVLGRTLIGLEMFPEAEQALDRARAELVQRRGDTDPAVLGLDHERARLLQKLGRWDEAATLLEATFAARRQHLGPNDRATLETWNNLAEVRVTQGDLEEAEAIFREVVERFETELGPKHPDTVTGLNNLAYVLRRRGDVAAAERLYRQALEANRATLGNAHPHTVSALHNLGTFLVSLDRFDEAEPMIVEALALSRAVHGDDGGPTLNIGSSLGVILLREGRFQEAAERFARARDAYARTVGPEHPDTLRSVNNLARALAGAGDTSSALDLFGPLLEATDRTLPAGHPYRAMFRASHAKVRHQAGELDAARAELRRALPGLQAALGPEHPSTVSAAELLAELEETE